MIKNRHKKIIKKIENIRKSNNKQWMKLLEIAFDYAPKESSKVLKLINLNDRKISNLLFKLSDTKRK